MNLYQVSAVFSDGIRYPAVEADSEQEAKARVAHAFAPDNGFYYCEAASPMDCLITREEFPLPEETTPLPHEEDQGCTFVVEMSTPYGTRYHTIPATVWQEAQDIADAAYRVAKQPGTVVEITKTVGLPTPKG